MPPPFHSSFFSSSRLSPTATALSFVQIYAMSGRVDFSFSLLHRVFSQIYANRFLLSYPSALTFLRTARWIFRKERLAQNDTWKFEIGSCKIRNVNPHHFLPLEKFLPMSGIEPGSALPIMSLMHLLQNSIDADMKIR